MPKPWVKPLPLERDPRRPLLPEPLRLFPFPKTLFPLAFTDDPPWSQRENLLSHSFSLSSKLSPPNAEWLQSVDAKVDDDTTEELLETIDAASLDGATKKGEMTTLLDCCCCCWWSGDILPMFPPWLDVLSIMTIFLICPF